MRTTCSKLAILPATSVCAKVEVLVSKPICFIFIVDFNAELNRIAGKYLNPPSMDIYCRVNGSHFPGWNAFLGMCNTAYYNVHWNDNGNLTFTGSSPTDYSTSIVGNRTVEFIRNAALDASKTDGGIFKPFLAVAATRAPHGPETPAPWYKNSLGHARNMRTPAWNYSAVARTNASF